MSAIGGKADVRELPSECLLIARSGHSDGFPGRGATPREAVEAEVAGAFRERLARCPALLQDRGVLFFMHYAGD